MQAHIEAAARKIAEANRGRHAKELSAAAMRVVPELIRSRGAFEQRDAINAVLGELGKRTRAEYSTAEGINKLGTYVKNALEYLTARELLHKSSGKTISHSGQKAMSYLWAGKDTGSLADEQARARLRKIEQSIAIREGGKFANPKAGVKMVYGLLTGGRKVRSDELKEHGIRAANLYRNINNIGRQVAGRTLVSKRNEYSAGGGYKRWMVLEKAKAPRGPRR